MATQATLVYSVGPVLLTAAQLQPLVAAVSLPFADLEPFGVTFVSDVTAVVGNVVQRTIVLRLVPLTNAFSGAFALSPPPAFQGCIVSSSPQDAPGGTGVSRVRILGSDTAGSPVAVTVTLNGTTPVPLPPLQNTPRPGPTVSPSLPLTPTPWQSVSYAGINAIVDPVTGVPISPAGMLSVFADGINNTLTNQNQAQALQQGQANNISQLSEPILALAQGAGDLAFQSAGSVSNGWSGCIVSTSPEDDSTATNPLGATNVQINYRDGTGTQRTIVSPLAGTRPVPLFPGIPICTLMSKAQGDPVDGIVVTASGLAGNNVNFGQISIFQGRVQVPSDAMGGIQTQIAGACAGYLPPSFLSQFPSTSLRVQFFSDLYLHILASALQSTVGTTVPVIS